MNCYCCSRKATHTVYLGIWREICPFHLEEALEEETGGVMVRTLENHEEMMKRERENQVA